MRPTFRTFSNGRGTMPVYSPHRSHPWAFYNTGMPRHAILPSDWNSAIDLDKLPVPSMTIWKTRREAENAVARAFAKLPIERRAELLRGFYFNTLSEEPLMTLAYSYVRFSHPSQLEGDSLRRQTERAADYCRRHGLTLDTALTLRDLGCPRSTGRTPRSGASARSSTR
jgi:hypothetical protein